MASLALLGYQGLVAAGTAVFAGSWLIAPVMCFFSPSCEPGAALVSVVGLSLLAESLLAATAVTVLFGLTLKWSSRGAPVTSIILEGLGILPAITFPDVIRYAGVPELGLFLFTVAVEASVCIILLSALELLVSDRIVRPHRLIVVAAFVAITFGAAGVPRVVTAYSSAQIGPDGFPLGPVTAEFVASQGSKLPLLYPSSVVRNTRATRETKTLNRFRLATWGETLGKNAAVAEVQAWYRQTLVAGGWQEISCQPGGCANTGGSVFVRGSRECLTVVVSGEGIGSIDIGYQITPSAKPLSGNLSADLRYCTGQY